MSHSHIWLILSFISWNAQKEAFHANHNTLQFLNFCLSSHTVCEYLLIIFVTNRYAVWLLFYSRYNPGLNFFQCHTFPLSYAKGFGVETKFSVAFSLDWCYNYLDCISDPGKARGIKKRKTSFKIAISHTQKCCMKYSSSG